MGGSSVAPPEQYREYLLAEVFGYTPLEIDEQPAVRLDWLIEQHRITVKVRNERQEEANRG